MENHNHQSDRGEKKYRVNPILPKSKEQVAAGNAYLADLSEIVRSRDLARFRAFLHTGKLALPDDMLSDPFKLLTLLHQLTLSLPELAELHAESQQWLDDNTILGRKGLNQAAQLTPQQKREELEASQPPAEEDGKPKPPRRTIFLRAFGAPPAPHRPSEN